jgi:hypothetical protein
LGKEGRGKEAEWGKFRGKWREELWIMKGKWKERRDGKEVGKRGGGGQEKRTKEGGGREGTMIREEEERKEWPVRR